MHLCGLRALYEARGSTYAAQWHGELAPHTRASRREVGRNSQRIWSRHDVRGQGGVALARTCSIYTTAGIQLTEGCLQP
jgi:hypothetical protein